MAGRFSVHKETNGNGRLLAEFATACGLIIKKTCFNNKKIHLGTWKVPGTDSIYQIDHLSVEDIVLYIYNRFKINERA